MSKQVLNQTEKKMMEAEKVLARELGSIRAGRANASLLEGIQVSYYGANTPLNQLAQISVPEARMLLITPFDKNVVNDIEKSINQSNLGITPSNGAVNFLIPDGDSYSKSIFSVPVPYNILSKKSFGIFLIEFDKNG